MINDNHIHGRSTNGRKYEEGRVGALGLRQAMIDFIGIKININYSILKCFLCPSMPNQIVETHVCTYYTNIGKVLSKSQ